MADDLFGLIHSAVLEGRNVQPEGETWDDDQASAVESFAMQLEHALDREGWLMVTQERRQAELAALDAALDALDVLAAEDEEPTQNRERAMCRLVVRSIRRGL